MVNFCQVESFVQADVKLRIYQEAMCSLSLYLNSSKFLGTSAFGPRYDFTLAGHPAGFGVRFKVCHEAHEGKRPVEAVQTKPKGERKLFKRA